MSENDLPVNSSTEAPRYVNQIDRILADNGLAVQLSAYV
jgi:hypothetical protein